MTWGTGPSASTTTWSASPSASTLGWSNLSVQTDAGGDIDFVLRASETGPVLVLPHTDFRVPQAWDSSFTTP